MRDYLGKLRLELGVRERNMFHRRRVRARLFMIRVGSFGRHAFPISCARGVVHCQTGVQRVDYKLRFSKHANQTKRIMAKITMTNSSPIPNT